MSDHHYGEDFGPILRGGDLQAGHRQGWRRAAKALVVTFVTMSLLLVVTGGALVLHGNRSVQRVDVSGIREPGDTDGDGTVDIEELTDTLNVLVVGSDSREGLSEEELAELSTTAEPGLRTDTIILVQLDPNRDQAALLSFPRDLLVTRCDGSRGRINAAYAIGDELGVGGPSCLVQTVTDFSGIPINHYVEVNFAGFIQVVDILGGVSLYLEAPIRDELAGVDLPSGCVTLNGAQALGFVRARHVDNDFGRIARQQRFIRELMQQATSLGTLANIPRLFSLVEALGQAVETDQDLSLNDMRRIAYSLRNLTADQLDTRTVPAVPRNVGGASLVVAKEEDAERLFQAFRDGSIFPPDLGTQGPVAVTAADVPPVLVLNGVGEEGLAAEAAAALEARGFSVTETDNADSFDFATSQIIYPDGRLEEAEVLAQALGGVALVPGGADADLTLVIGEDFDADTLPPPPTQSPVETPSPEPTFVGAAPPPASVNC